MFGGSKKCKKFFFLQPFLDHFKIHGEIRVYFFQAFQCLEKCYEKKSVFILNKLNRIGFR